MDVDDNDTMVNFWPESFENVSNFENEKVVFSIADKGLKMGRFSLLTGRTANM